jgi:hypothetical protein
VKSETYKIERDTKLDFVGEAYATTYPNLHRYPATMIPQLGISLLERHEVTRGRMLDPYCGSGSSFAAGVHVGMSTLYGFDLNPLAVLISRVKFTRLDTDEVLATQEEILSKVKKAKPANENSRDIPKITNIDYWFPRDGVLQLVAIKRLIDKIEHEDMRNLFLLALSETIRDVSYTRKNEFKLYRIPAEKLATHHPDATKIFSNYLVRICEIYLTRYLPKLKGVKVSIQNQSFDYLKSKVDVLLTSPPYGDSRTTVAYGQFSTLTNEWLGIVDARKIDAQLMGGRRVKSLLEGSIISKQLIEVSEVDAKRALEVSSFYEDLGSSIREVGNAISNDGLSIYIVGNRRVKDVQLATDQFIAEEFERSGFRHLVTYERLISSKSMPASNSPSNKTGVTRGTMTQEFIVVCQKSK